jgi:hypothetical protein
MVEGRLTPTYRVSGRPRITGPLSFTVAAGCAFHRERVLFLGIGRGCSSGVEHHVSNVRVGGSNPFARSNEIKDEWFTTCLAGRPLSFMES